MYSFNARRNEASPNKISFDRHSRRIELTQRSAKAFRFWLLGGRLVAVFRLTAGYREMPCGIFGQAGETHPTRFQMNEEQGVVGGEASPAEHFNCEEVGSG